VALALESEPQPEFDLSGSAEGVDACPNTDTVYIMARASRPVDLPGSSSQQSIQARSWQIKIDKVEQIKKSHAGLKAEPLVNCVGPSDCHVESAQPKKIDLAGRCERHRWSASSPGLSASCEECAARWTASHELQKSVVIPIQVKPTHKSCDHDHARHGCHNARNDSDEENEHT